MASFIRITLDDFEAQFNMLSRTDPTKRVFSLLKPQGQEAYYSCITKSNSLGRLELKVLTSIRSDRKLSRDCGEDAIRCLLIWQDAQGWEAIIDHTTRTNRCGDSAYDIVKRVLDKAREMLRQKIPACPSCGRPMVLRTIHGTNRQFWGCCGYKQGCRGSRQL
jgi:ribosomal protein S27AE